MTNNNDCDILEKLSFLIIKEIVEHLNDNIDKLCFSIACKRFYENKDKYLQFNFINQHEDGFSLANFRSYTDILMTSESNQKEYISNIKKKTFNYTYTLGYDPVKYYDYEKSHECVNFKDIVLPDDIYKFKCHIFKIDIDKSFYNKLLHSNVTTLSLHCHFELTPGCLPPTIKKIKLWVYEGNLKVGCLPESLEELIVTEMLECELKPGVLPASLTSLHLNRYEYELTPGVLPQSLQKLQIDCLLGQEELQLNNGTLPPNLLYLSFGNTEFTDGLNIDIIPTSLQYLEGVPHDLMSELGPKLINLKELRLIQQEPGSDNSPFDLSCIPQSVTRFTFYSLNFKFIGTFPESIKYINLNSPDCGEIQQSIISDIKFPSNLEELNIGLITHCDDCFGKSNSLKRISLPSSIKKLTLSYTSQFQLNIPASVEVIEFKFLLYAQNLLENLDKLPTTVRELILDPHYANIIGNENLLKIPLSIKTIRVNNCILRRIGNSNFVLYNRSNFKGGFTTLP